MFSPTNHVLPAWDLVTGQMAALGLLAAERHRFRTGEGQHTKIALSDAAMAVMGHLGFIAEAQLGEDRPRYGNYLYGAFGRDFMTSDDQRVMVIGLTKRQWKSLCEATDSVEKMTELAQRLGRDFSKEGDRFESRDDISAVFSEFISARSYVEIEKLFNAKGVCWSRYQTVKQMVETNVDCSLANPMFSQINQAGVGEYMAAGAPWDFSAFAREPAKPAPRLGEQTDEVLADVVGLSSAEIGRLHDTGIIAGPEA